MVILQHLYTHMIGVLSGTDTEYYVGYTHRNQYGVVDFEIKVFEGVPLGASRVISGNGISTGKIESSTLTSTVVQK